MLFPSSSSRRAFVKTAAAALAGAPAVLGKAERRPNFVYVLVDQWRAQAAGYAGDPNAQTPALDRLAAQSVNFVNAVSGLPVCSPYRGSLMTGQFPLTNGVFINDVVFAPKTQTLGEAFRAGGYQTGYIGKWHLYGSPGGGNERRTDYIPADKRFGFDYWKVCECTHNYNRSPYYAGDDKTQRTWPGYDAIAQIEDACGFIGRQAKAADPFFLVVSVGPPHSPYGTAPGRYRALYEKRAIELRRNVPASLREKAEADLRGYYAHIAALDDCVANIAAALDKNRVADDTVLVFTSDHGDMLYSQGLVAKHHPWSESNGVPFLVRYPRKLGTAARKIRQPINTPDIMPTLLGLAGLPVPGAVQGSDLSSVILGKRAADPDAPALLNLPVTFTQSRRCGFAEYRGLRTDRHTYVRSVKGPWLLYDNETDPYQMNNLCGRAEHKAVLSRLDGELDRRLRAVKDDFLPGQTYLERAGLAHYKEANAAVGSCVSPWGDWKPTMGG